MLEFTFQLSSGVLAGHSLAPLAAAADGLNHFHYAHSKCGYCIMFAHFKSDSIYPIPIIYTTTNIPVTVNLLIQQLLHDDDALWLAQKRRKPLRVHYACWRGA